jgi:hypothetical protein
MSTFSETYRKCELVAQCLPDMPINDQCSGFWQLDEKMRQAFAPYIQQYEQGLIHSMELVSGLMLEVNRNRD